MSGGRRSVFLIFAATLVAALSGCSSNPPPKTVPVQGKVVFKKGKPLANVTVQFIPVSETNSFIANGTTDQNGAFQLQTYFDSQRVKQDGAVPGKYKVVASVPWCTFTDPELAHAGLTEAEAREQFKGDVEVWRQDLIHNDRARADGASEGAVIVITHKKKIVGAHILAPAAGEMIHEFALAIEEGVGFSELSQFMHVYPTVSTSVGQLAGEAAFEKAEKYRWLVKRK